MTNRQRIAQVAMSVLAGRVEPLTACRRILALASDEERKDSDITTIVGIDSETDHLPDADHRHLWDAAALVAKDAESEEYFKRAGPRMREACIRLAAKWRG